MDVGFDLRAEIPGLDPDRYSNRLRGYHRALWGRPLPGGNRLDLDERLVSRDPPLRLSSDAICPTYLTWKRPSVPSEVRASLDPEVVRRLVAASGTVGAFIVFPVPDVAIPRTQSINQARGIHPKVRDRFDLTLECIRRHYRGEASPLSDSLEKQRGFFSLFGDFDGYVSFFMLDDLVVGDAVTDLTTSEELTGAAFDDEPFPGSSVSRFTSYAQHAADFVCRRNARVASLPG